MTNSAFIKSWIILLLLSLLSPLGEAALAGVPSAERNASRLSELPLETQFAVSSSLGRDDPDFHAIASSSGYRLNNCVQQLSATFDASDVAIQTGSVRWEFGLTSYGYGDERSSISGVVPRRTPIASNTSAEC